MKITGIGNAIVDVICKVDDEFLARNDLAKSNMKLIDETEFKQLTPPKNRAGNRTYRQKDIDIILEIKNLLHGKKFTIEGARAAISSKVVKPSQSEVVNSKLISTLKNELYEILQIIKK